MFFRFLLLVGSITLSGPASLIAQQGSIDPERGHSPIKNWTARDYVAFSQNWVLKRDSDGRIYSGNRDQVLMYDGLTWTKLPVPGVFIRGLDFAADGTLYVGGVDQLGFFKRNALGEWGPFESLVEKLPASEREFREIWSVHALPDGVYFAIEKQLFRWRDGVFKTWRLDSEWNTFVHRVGDTLYFDRRETPLRRLVGDDFVDVPAPPEVVSRRTAGIIDLPNGGLLLAWPRHGLATLRNGELGPWAPDWTQWFIDRGVGGLSRLDDSTLAVATLRDGILLFDNDGRMLQRIDLNAGLYNPIVRDTLVDAEGGIWMAMNHGVAQVDALSNYTLFDSLNGLGRSTTTALVRHQGILYAGSAEGLYRLVPASGDRMARFELVPGAPGPVTSLQTHRAGLIIGSNEGIFFRPDDGSPIYHVCSGGAWQILPSFHDRDFFWVTGFVQVYSCRFDGKRLVSDLKLASPNAEMRRIVERQDGSLWTSTTARGLLRWASPRTNPSSPPEEIGESVGLPSEQSLIRIVEWQGRLHASVHTGVYVWDDTTRRFNKIPVQGDYASHGSYNIYGGDPNYLWTFFGSNRQNARVTRIDAQGKVEELPHQLTQAMGDVEMIWREERDGREILWVGGSFGLARVDLKKQFLPRSDFAALFGMIERSHEPGTQDGTFVWPHGKSDFEVSFSATTYRSGPNLAFQSRLLGYDDKWSEWTRNTHRSFTNLSAGKYQLELKARDADGRVGRGAAFSFIILPPWWGTPWAYAGYALAALLLVYGIVRWRVRLSERERERLQKLVAERTCQLAESQKDLLQAKDAAEAANRAKSAFLASMSHELRTPLNSVLGYAQILRRSPEVGVNARRSIETIQRSGDHLLHLINEVLDLAKVEAGRAELHESPFELNRFVQSISELFAIRAIEKGLLFSTPDPHDFNGLVVRGDEARLRQILVNLLGNAFKFTDRGRVGWKLTRHQDGHWAIEVLDTGVGISEEDRARIFDPFYQSTSRPNLARQGTGLGLSISAHFVQLMGGKLQVESAPGQGSRFWFEIALPVLENVAPAEISRDGHDAPIVGYKGRRRRLLVIDDEKSNRAILDEMLTPLGFVIEEADGAEAARAAIARQAPDAVLLDLRMPGDDGFVLAREWRANGALLGAKVLALSASVLAEQQTEALAAGCDAFLAKPFKEEQLLRVLGSLIELEWLYSSDDDAEAVPDSPAAPSTDSGPAREVRWEAGLLQRLLQLAEHGDALRLGEELAALARRGAAWAAIVTPWQKLAGGYQMEALSRVLEETLRGERSNLN